MATLNPISTTPLLVASATGQPIAWPLPFDRDVTTSRIDAAASTLLPALGGVPSTLLLWGDSLWSTTTASDDCLHIFQRVLEYATALDQTQAENRLHRCVYTTAVFDCTAAKYVPITRIELPGADMSPVRAHASPHQAHGPLPEADNHCLLVAKLEMSIGAWEGVPITVLVAPALEAAQWATHSVLRSAAATGQRISATAAAPLAAPGVINGEAFQHQGRQPDPMPGALIQQSTPATDFAHHHSHHSAVTAALPPETGITRSALGSPDGLAFLFPLDTAKAVMVVVSGSASASAPRNRGVGADGQIGAGGGIPPTQPSPSAPISPEVMATCQTLRQMHCVSIPHSAGYRHVVARLSATGSPSALARGPATSVEQLAESAERSHQELQRVTDLYTQETAKSAALQAELDAAVQELTRLGGGAGIAAVRRRLDQTAAAAAMSPEEVEREKLRVLGELHRRLDVDIMDMDRRAGQLQQEMYEAVMELDQAAADLRQNRRGVAPSDPSGSVHPATPNGEVQGGGSGGSGHRVREEQSPRRAHDPDDLAGGPAQFGDNSPVSGSVSRAVGSLRGRGGDRGQSPVGLRMPARPPVDFDNSPGRQDMGGDGNSAQDGDRARYFDAQSELELADEGAQTFGGAMVALLQWRQQESELLLERLRGVVAALSASSLTTAFTPDMDTSGGDPRRQVLPPIASGAGATSALRGNALGTPLGGPTAAAPTHQLPAALQAAGVGYTAGKLPPGASMDLQELFAGLSRAGCVPDGVLPPGILSAEKLGELLIESENALDDELGIGPLKPKPHSDVSGKERATLIQDAMTGPQCDPRIPELLMGQASEHVDGRGAAGSESTVEKARSGRHWCPLCGTTTAEKVPHNHPLRLAQHYQQRIVTLEERLVQHLDKDPLAVADACLVSQIEEADADASRWMYRCRAAEAQRDMLEGVLRQAHTDAPEQ